MAIISMLEKQVDRMFNALHAVRGGYCFNPVTDAAFIWGVHPIKAQKEDAVRALVARNWFAINGPADAQPLPVSYSEREDLKCGGVSHILAWYARSLEALNHDVKGHPSFEDFACGVMARLETPDFIRNNPSLQQRFPPRALVGLGIGMMWEAPASTTKRRCVAARRR